MGDIELPGTLQLPSRIAQSLYPIIKYKLSVLLHHRRTRIGLSKLGKELEHYEILIEKKKVDLYSDIKELKLGEQVGEKALKKVKRELASLVDKLLRIEKLENSLEQKKLVLEKSKLTKHVKNELSKIDKYERKLELQKKHVEKILYDASQHLREREEKVKHLEEYYTKLENLVQVR